MMVGDHNDMSWSIQNFLCSIVNRVFSTEEIVDCEMGILKQDSLMLLVIANLVGKLELLKFFVEHSNFAKTFWLYA